VQPAVARQYVPAVLNVYAAFEHRFHQIAHSTYYANDRAHNGPFYSRQFSIKTTDDQPYTGSYNNTTNKAFPGFFRRMALK